MKKSLIRIMASIALLTIGGASFAQSSCTAKNTDDTSVVCEVTCSEGETASCHDSSGGNEPTCECDFSGYIKNNAHNFPFKKYKTFTPKFQQIENTNIIQVINERIKTPPHHVADACRQVPVGRQCLLKPGHECNFLPKPGLEGAKFVCAPECTQQYQTVCDPIMAPLTVAGPILLEGNPVVVVEKPNWNDIPSRAIGLRVHYKNCSPVEQSYTYQQTETTRVGARVLKTKTVDAGVDITASVEFDFFEKAGLSVKFSSKTSITNTNEENMQVDKTSSYTMPIKVSPMSVVTVEHAYIQREVPVRYSGTVQVDAAISNNLDGIKLMSQIYSNPADRKFVFAGVVLSSQLNDSDVVLGYTKLRDQDCAEQLGKSVAMPETFTREYSKE